MCEGEPESTFNQYAVAMKKEGTFIGHLLEAVTRVLSFAVANITCN